MPGDLTLSGYVGPVSGRYPGSRSHVKTKLCEPMEWSANDESATPTGGDP